ncbi:MAG: HDIG domain-containing protein, partial [Synergistaceae bacterium]|nr:HDIG domain-containing protein [Synergistaceae bacterium]
CMSVVFILPLIENYIDVLSVLQLRELSHPSSPLLRQMQREAPGTYQHCLTIASLAEAVAPELGLDVNLMKTGAYYHDIGKMRKPQYFVENQGGGINTHDAMSPKLSALSIIWHIKDGLESAREAKLPRRIQDFIAEHHGTTCVRYFYNKACAQAKPGEVINWADFCYPGPKPQTKETALLMIIDSVEAAVRSANLGRRPSDYDAKQPHQNKGKSQYILALQQIISQVINSKINEGQFDEVNLTQRDLTQIKNSLLTALLSMYHTRSVKKIEKK